MEFTVFYAWQSDRFEKTNRYLIRDAAEKAVKTLIKDSTIDESPRLDHDTKDEPGLAEIAGTIFRKIEGCGLFLADLTFVGATPRQKGRTRKLLPNSNVVLELGYAARSIGWERVIAVMNTAYGPPNELIFDVLHRRWPIEFNIKDEATDRIAQVRTELAGKIADWIRGAMKAEHAATEEAIKSLDVSCMRIMTEAGTSDYFSEPQTFASHHLLNKLAIYRLLDLRLIYADHDPSQQLYAYHWTHRGRLALFKLGIRTQPPNAL